MAGYGEFIRLDYIFFIWTHGKQELERFLKDVNKFSPNLSLLMKLAKIEFHF